MEQYVTAAQMFKAFRGSGLNSLYGGLICYCLLSVKTGLLFLVIRRSAYVVKGE
jgi:hypothetical protein